MFTAKTVLFAHVLFALPLIACANSQIVEKTIEHKASTEQLWTLDRVSIKSYQPHGRKGLRSEEAKTTLNLLYSILYQPVSLEGGPYRAPGQATETEIGEQVDRIKIELSHGDTSATDRTTILVQPRGMKTTPHVAFNGILPAVEYRGLVTKIARNAKYLELRSDELSVKIEKLSHKLRQSIKELEHEKTQGEMVKTLKGLHEQLRRSYYGGAWAALGNPKDSFDAESLERKVESDRDKGQLMFLEIVDSFRVISAAYERIVVCPSHLEARNTVHRP